MKKIKILRIITRLNIGGPAIHTVLLTEGLDKSKFDSLLVCGSIKPDEGDMSYYAGGKNLELLFIKELKRELNFIDDLIAFIKIYRVIKREQPDIIHCHTTKAGALGRLAGILYNFLHSSNGKKIRLIYTSHGHIFEGYFNKFKTRCFIYIERFLSPFTSKIVLVSESLRKEIISLRIAKRDKIAVIPLGLELDKFLTIPPRLNSNLNVGIVGRLAPIKNHYLFLEAAAKVIGDNPRLNVKFKIIGDGELRMVLEEFCQSLDIKAQVDFLGWQKDLVVIYSDLDIVALTSINEGTPVSLIEAMACAKAIVATAVGGVADLLGGEIDIPEKPKENFKLLERGIIVKSMDASAFAGALSFLLRNDDLRRRMGFCGRDFAKIKFTKTRLIRDIENLYVSVLGNK